MYALPERHADARGWTGIPAVFAPDNSRRLPERSSSQPPLSHRSCGADPNLTRSRCARGFGTFYLLPGDQHLDAETAEGRLRAAGANAVVFMRVVGQDQRITYTPGTVIGPRYRGFGPYWGAGWRTVYQPGTVRTDTLVSVETLVYSLAADRTSQLLWASTSRTTNPSGLDALVSEVAEATARQMARDGFLAR